jgi:NAD-specific glutamate dehydrogenase
VATSPDERKAALLEATVARVHERVEGADAEDVERFVRAYYAHVAPDDLSDRSDLDLYGAAVAHRNLARVRRPGESKVHVYTPNVDEHGWESPHTVVKRDPPRDPADHAHAARRRGPAARGRRGRGLPESLIHVEIDRKAVPEELDRLRADLCRVLGDVCPLRREIIASRVSNDLVNRAGTTFAFRLADETGAGADDIARAYTAAREVFGLRGLWGEIEALDGRVPAETQIAMLLRSRILLEWSTRWLRARRRGARRIPARAARPVGARGRTGESWTACFAVRIPPELAERVAHLEALVPALELVEVAAAAQLEIAAAAEVYFALGARLELHWLRDRIVDLPRATRWEAMARAALRDDVYSEQAGLTAEVLRSGGQVERWLAENRSAVERSLQVLADIRSAGTLDLARLSVAVREIRNLIHSSGAAEPAAQPAPHP